MLEISFQNSIPHTFAGTEFAPKEQGPNLGTVLVGRILTKVMGFPSTAGIQKYHIKVKQRGALVKNQAEIGLVTTTRTCRVGKFFSELNPTSVCSNGICSKGARPKPWRSLGRANFDKSHGFPSIPGIQKYHTKGKQTGALVKGQARKLLW